MSYTEKQQQKTLMRYTTHFSKEFYQQTEIGG